MILYIVQIDQVCASLSLTCVCAPVFFSVVFLVFLYLTHCFYSLQCILTQGKQQAYTL